MRFIEVEYKKSNSSKKTRKMLIKIDSIICIGFADCKRPILYYKIFDWEDTHRLAYLTQESYEKIKNVLEGETWKK